MTEPRDGLTQLLEAAQVASAEIGPEELQRIWALTGQGDEVLFDEFLDAVVQTCQPTWQGDPLAPDELGLRVRNWQIDLRKEAVQASLRGAIVGVVLSPRGFADFTVLFLSTIVPSLFDIERIELSAGDQKLLLELRMRPELRDRFLADDDLYDALPEETRSVINRYDFADFLGRLRQGGFAETRDDGAVWIWPT